MKKYNKLCYPILLCISFLYIYGTHVNRKNNHFYEIKHDEIVHNILNNENFDKEYKIKAIRSLKYYNKKYQNRLIAKLHGTYKRKNKNIYALDKPTNPDEASKYFHDQRKDNYGETHFEKYVEYRDYFRDKTTIEGIVKPSDPRNANRTTVRTDDPCKASNAGFTMTKVNDSRDNATPLKGDGYISSIVVHPSDESIVYVTSSAWGDTKVWKSTDCGDTWSNLDNGNIPDIPVNHIFIDPYDSNRLYLATDLGVMYSGNDGKSWASINTNGMANVITERFDYDVVNRFLYAFTYGRGVFAIKLP